VFAENEVVGQENSISSSSFWTNRCEMLRHLAAIFRPALMKIM